MTSTLKFLIIFALLILFLLVMGVTPSAAWLSLPVLVAVQLLMMLAIGIVLASVVPFLPDLKLIIDNLMMVLMFVFGILFDISSLPEGMKAYLYLNPMAGMIESYRFVLLDGVWPDWLFLAKLVLLSTVGLMVGLGLLHRYDRIYVKVI